MSDEYAFPTLAEVNGREVVGGNGISVRDYFAAHALAVVAQYDAVRGEKIDNLHDADACIAGWAYAIADAMLAERAKRMENRS